MKTGKGRDEVRSFLEGKRRTTRPNSMVLEADNTSKSGMTVEEVEGGG
jgi:hypothetical protein